MKFYFDTNVISYLEDSNQYISQTWFPLLQPIKDYLNMMPDEDALFYSPAHLSDIRQGYTKNSARALEKLSFISGLTKNRCIVRYAYHDEIRFETRSPTEFFLTNPDNDEGFFQNEGNKFSLLELVESSGAYEGYKSLPINYKEAEPVFATLGVVLHRTKEDPTAYSLLLDFAEFLSNLLSEGHVFYKALKEKAKQETGIADKLINSQDPISLLNHLLPQSNFGKQFKDIMHESFEQDVNNRRDRISHLYMDLDLLGYKSDKVTESHGYMNLIADTDHCYYASYCDFYVTNDHRAAAKAKAVLSHLNIQVRVFDIVEFAEWIKNG